MKRLKTKLAIMITAYFILVLTITCCFLPISIAGTTDKVIKLKAAYFVPAKGLWYEAIEWYMKEVEARSKGRVVFERYWAQSLVGAKDVPDALSGGIADVGTLIPGYYPGKFPLSDMGTLPGLADHNWPILMGFYEVYQEVPELQQEFARRGVKMLFPLGGGPYKLLTKDKEIKSIADIKGLKIRTFGYQAELLHALGGTPITMPAPDMYDALHKGTIDGSVLDDDMVHNYGVDRVAKYYSDITFGFLAAPLAINTKKYNSLPDDIQKILDQTSIDAIKAFCQFYEIDGLPKQRAAAVKEGVKLTKFPDSEAEKVKAIGKEHVLKKWVEDREKKGLPGQKVLDAYIKAINKYKQQDPFKNQY